MITLAFLTIVAVTLLLQARPNREADAHIAASERLEAAGDYDAAGQHAEAGCAWSALSLIIGALALLAVVALASVAVPPRGL